MQYVKLTPPAVRTNTDLAILFNSDHKDSIKSYQESFAGKLDPILFEMMFRKYCEDVEHGFLAIHNDPNIPASKKYFYGKAEEVPVGRESIVGCAPYWKDNEKQLKDIQDGTIVRKLARLKALSDADEGEFPDI